MQRSCATSSTLTCESSRWRYSVTAALTAALVLLAPILLLITRVVAAPISVAPRQLEAPAARVITPALMREAMERTLTQPPSQEEREADEAEHNLGYEPNPALSGEGVEPPAAEAPALAPEAPAVPESLSGRGVPAIAAPQSVFGYVPRMTRNWFAGEEGGYPPDPQIAAGQGHVVTVINGRIDIFAKDGTALYTSSLYNLFSLPAGYPGPFDPKIQYDEASQRFFVLTLANDTSCAFASYFYLAVSQTSDPTQGWYVWTLRNELEGYWVDYPGLGVSDRGVYLSGNYLGGCCCPSGTSCPSCNCACPGSIGTSRVNTLWALPKAQVLAGATFTSWAFDDLPDDEGRPMQSLNPTLTHGLPAGVESFVVALPGGTFSGGVHKLLVFGITLPPGFPAVGPGVNRREVVIPTALALTLAPQQGGCGLLNTSNIGAPPLGAVYRSGFVWTSSHYGNGGAPNRTIIRVYKVDVSSWPTLVLNGTNYVDDGASWHYYSGVTANRFGDAGVVLSRSGPAEYPGSAWAVRLKDDVGFGSLGELAPGEFYYGNPTLPCTPTPVFRWGDYAGAAVDAADQGFWFCHQYATMRPDGNGYYRIRAGYVPRAVFVDGATTGTQAGSRSRPWSTVFAGHSDALSGNDLVIRTGVYPEALTLSKGVTIFADGGAVTIGDLTP